MSGVRATYICWNCDQEYTKFNTKEGVIAKCPQCKTPNGPGYEVITYSIFIIEINSVNINTAFFLVVFQKVYDWLIDRNHRHKHKFSCIINIEQRDWNLCHKSISEHLICSKFIVSETFNAKNKINIIKNLKNDAFSTDSVYGKFSRIWSRTKLHF